VVKAGGQAAIYRIRAAIHSGSFKFAAGGAVSIPNRTVSATYLAPAQASLAQFDRLLALLEKSPALTSCQGPLVHVDSVNSVVDLDMFARQAEFKQRMGSF
jgi:hypothetical protein